MIKNPYKTINKTIILLIISLLGYLVWDIINTKAYVYKLPRLLTQTGTSKSNTSTLENQLKSFSYYIDNVKRRNIFLPKSVVLVKKEVTKESERPKIPITTLTTGLRVVGFSLGNPNMVMIEDSGKSRTHFLKAGDTINDLVITEVKKDGVTLTDGFEEIILK